MLQPNGADEKFVRNGNPLSFGETDAGYYFASAALQPFLRYESLSYSDAAFRSRDQSRWGAGFNWYVSNQNLKLSALYEQIRPRVAAAG